MMPPVSLGKREACDNCYKRKVRCDGDNVPGNVCSECSRLNRQCTRDIVKRKRGPKSRYPQTPPDSESVQSLISAILAAPTAFNVPTSTHVVRRMLVDLALHSQALEKEVAYLRSLQGETAITSELSPPASNEEPPETDSTKTLGDRLEGLSLNHYQDRQFEQSSHISLLQTALDARDNLDEGSRGRISIDLKRSQFWDLKPWHAVHQYEPIPYEYPPEDLFEHLLALYWEHLNPFYPLLHRPTFEKSIAAKLHLYDQTFGSTVLAVCALASRYSDDPRVLYGDMTSKHSAGWRYFNQIEFVPNIFLESPSVYALQVYPLSVIFMLATHMVETCWVLIGTGVQLAQMIGVHRSGFGKGRDVKEVELWKRAFWQLIMFDTAVSIALGRPKLTHPNDLDLELPIVCDDEYWEPPNLDDAFKQPKNIPSQLTFLIHHIKLMEILGFAQHSIYSVRHLYPWGPTNLSTAEWNQKALSEIDSALNKWIEELPDFLKFNPHQKDAVFAHQSVMLYAGFYWVQIQVHRHFMSGPGQKSISMFPSLAICTNAARSCVHILNGHHQQYQIRFAHLVPPIFSCATVLLINLWRGIQSKISLNTTEEMNNIQKCLDMLALYEDRFEMAGRFLDILLSVISVSQIPPGEKLSSLKRTRSLYEGSSMSVHSDKDVPTSRPGAGSQQTAWRSQYNPSTNLSLESFNVNLGSDFADWSFPVTSNDLSGLPVHIDAGTDMDLPCDSVACNSESTLLPTQGIDGMIYELGTGQFTNSTSSSQIEWNQFMTEVDELLQWVGRPSTGQS